MPDLLIELFSEEIPARMQARGADDLKRLVTDGLVDAGLTYAAAAAFATPRRLALTVEGLLARSPDTREERKGPRTDAPEKALEGFLRSTGLTRDQLEARQDKKGEVWFALIEKPGREAAEIVAEVLEGAIRTFPWPKSMTWGSGSLRWVRPLHSILCILSDEAGAVAVPLSIDGIAAGNLAHGHRFMAPAAFAVSGFEDYEHQLKRAHVVLRSDERAEMIWNDAEHQAFAQGLELVEDRGLLAEVAGLVEWPVVLMGDIGPDFLDLPPEVLQTSMREHQKFFSVRNPKTDRIEKYVTVANRETADQGAAILAGNGKVLAARLSDAKFFWENDLRKSLDDFIVPLTQVTFQSSLGTQAARLDRLRALVGDIAPHIPEINREQAMRAAQICKADLTSEMVYEFPELQGIMGRYYALRGKEAAAVADACRDHYAPLGPTDDCPRAPVTVAVALADKIDLLTGFWAIDEKPTGSKDPFALRRAALGVIRTVVDNGLRLPLLPVIASAEAALLAQGVAAKAADVGADLLRFVHDRLKVHLKGEGIRHDVIDACLGMPGADDIALLVARARALEPFFATPDGENLLQGYKRANNILTAEEKKDGIEYSLDPDVKFAETDTERQLFAALDTAKAAIEPALLAEDFPAALAAMSALRAPIDGFFEAVQVNTDNQVVRRNRLCLLHRIRTIMGQVAVFDAVEG